MATNGSKAKRPLLMLADRALPYDLPPPPDLEVTAAFVAQHGRGTSTTIEYLCQNNLRLLPYCLQRVLGSLTHLPPLCEASDLVQEGFFALRQAAALYDPAKGCFSTYAVCCIENKMRTVITRAAEHSQREVALDEHHEVWRTAASLCQSDAHVSDEIDARQKQQIVKRAISTLNQRERKILTMRFGLNRKPPATLQKVGDKCAVSKERIRQIQTVALQKMRRRLFMISHAHPEHMID